MFSEMVLAYARSGNVRQDLVRSASDAHSAGPRVQRMLKFLRVGLAGVVPAEKLALLDFGKILRSVENRRSPADPMVRRTYTDAEMDRMMEACKSDPKATLMLVLLREVGLRARALAHLRYFSLVDEAHEPRRVCSVPEKGQALRHFVASARLSEAIRRYYGFLRPLVDEALGGRYADAFVFAGKDLAKPVCRNMLWTYVRRAAAAGGVTDVRVHPHAFRHTIVGQLIDAGNPMELVSKYMGHKSVDVTSNSYHVANVQELHDRINNPFSGNYQRRATEEERRREALELLRLKKNKCLDIVHAYNVILGRLSRSGGSAADAVKEILGSMPKLGEILGRIDDDSDVDGDGDGDDDGASSGSVDDDDGDASAAGEGDPGAVA